MKIIFLLLALSLTAQYSNAQTDSNAASAPPPPAEPAAAAPASSTTTTTITTTTEPARPAAPAPAAPAPAAAAPPAQATVIVTPPPPAPPAPAYDGPADHGSHLDVRRIRLGAYLAPTISWMHPTATKDDLGEYNVSGNGSKVGFMYGLMLDYNFAPNYAVATGLQINSTGGKVLAQRISTAQDKDVVTKADFEYNVSYLEIPLALKLRTYDFNGFRFFGQLGVTAGINIGKKATYTVNFVNDNYKDSVASGSKIKLTGGLGNIAPVLFEMNIGIGTEYRFGNGLTGYFGLFFNNGFAPDATKPDLFDGEKLGYKGSFHDANTRLNNFAFRFGLFF